MKSLPVFLVFFLLLCSANYSLAVLPDEILDNPALEARARTLSSQLRCLVCQNETIDASFSPLARDLRLLIREKLQAGENDDAIINFIVARYGEFVLLRPPFHLKTAFLWLSPFVILTIVFSIIFVRLRRSNR